MQNLPFRFSTTQKVQNLQKEKERNVSIISLKIKIKISKITFEILPKKRTETCRPKTKIETLVNVSLKKKTKLIKFSVIYYLRNGVWALRS
jgi:hypothetical protein